MATIAFTKIGSTVKMVIDTATIAFKPSKMIGSIEDNTITYKYPGSVTYGFSFLATDTITADGSPVTGTAAEILAALSESMFS